MASGLGEPRTAVIVYSSVEGVRGAGCEHGSKKVSVDGRPKAVAMTKSLQLHELQAGRGKLGDGGLFRHGLIVVVKKGAAPSKWIATKRR